VPPSRHCLSWVDPSSPNYSPCRPTSCRWPLCPSVTWPNRSARPVASPSRSKPTATVSVLRSPDSGIRRLGYGDLVDQPTFGHYFVVNGPTDLRLAEGDRSPP